MSDQEKSLIHTWDVRFKILYLVLYIAAVTLSYSYFSLVTGITGAVVLFAFSNTSVKRLLNFLKTPVIILLLLIAPLLILSSGGDPVYHYGVIKIYREGLVLTSVVFLRLSSIVILIFILINTERSSSIIAAVRYFRIPDKLVSIFTMTYRYIFFYNQELIRLRNASVLRGGSTLSSLAHLRNGAGTAFSMLLKGYEQSERVNDAMCMRGFSGRFHSLEELNAEPLRDTFLFAVLLIFPVLMIISEYCVW